MKRLIAGVAASACCLILVAASATATPTAGTAASGVTAGTAATAANSATGAPARASLRGFSCHRAMDPALRSVAVTAVMRPLAGTRHMAVKFDLLIASKGTAPQKVVQAGDLGVWITPKNPTLGQLPGDVWNLRKSVVSLAAPANYRFRVTYRWTGTSGNVLGKVVRYSHTCQQRELRPDLAVASINVSPDPSSPGSDLYKAVIANLGNSGSGPFNVLFATADGSSQAQTVAVPKLKPHANITETFSGPVCTAANDPTITADSTNEVNDLNRANNSMTAVCPGSSAS